MKTGLVAAGAAALLLLGSLGYWSTRPDRESAPEIHAREIVPALDTAPAELEAAEPMPEQELAPSPRSEVELPPGPEPRLEGDITDRASFQKKYAGIDAAGRAAAMEEIRRSLGGDLLDAEAIVSLGNELQWLMAHEKP